MRIPFDHDIIDFHCVGSSLVLDIEMLQLEILADRLFENCRELKAMPHLQYVYLSKSAAQSCSAML